MTALPASVTPIVSKLIEDTGERLVKIKRTGMYLDPLSITLVHAVLLAGRNENQRTASVPQGKVIIETRNKGSYTLPCPSIAEARQLADYLAKLANTRAKDSARVRVQRETDWGKTRLAGDPEYEKMKEEREQVFKFFDH